MRAERRWIKKGVIFAPETSSDWLCSHAALPVPDRIGDLHRVYFSSRDREGRAQIGFFETDLDKIGSVLRVSEKAVIGLGAMGAFDENGVTTSWIVTYRKRKYLYYSGWTLGVTVPFYFYVGLAISDDGGETYQRLSPAPILERNTVDPYLTASPCVIVEDGKWRMWYVSGTGWEIRNDRPRHHYHIKYAESSDGIHWDRQGIVCIDYRSSEEYAIARPCVVKDGATYKMWYSSRGDRYRIGYAESEDGITWARNDRAGGLGVSESGWDSEMVEYPYVLEHKGRRFMFYNGNDYGRTGIGLAVLEAETGHPRVSEV